MTKSDFFLGPDRDLTKDEIEALLHVKAGVRVPDWAYTKLQMADLIEMGIYGWKLTKAGDFRLATGR